MSFTMLELSVIVCTRNPRHPFLRRVFDSLEIQTLPKDGWELLVVDNASDKKLADEWDLSWHPRARHVREENLGLTPARLRGIRETRGDILVFFDDDNVPVPEYLENVCAVHQQHSQLGTFGAGSIEPEFDVAPPDEIRPLLQKLALRTVPSARWSTDANDFAVLPWGVGLSVRRPVAELYSKLVGSLDSEIPLDRVGGELYCGGDDMFSTVAAWIGQGFGIFPQLRVTHLIPPERLTQSYFLKLINDHAYSTFVRHYLCNGVQPQRINGPRRLRALLHGIRRGHFRMQCRMAALDGEDRAARLIDERQLRPLIPLGLADLMEILQPSE
jgi:glycosyltransferase involved in cell wall biosynthesis